MRLGLLADIHEQTKQVRKAIAVLQQHGAERFVVRGDVFELGKRMEETVALLQQVQAVGVWGNQDIGLCFDPDEKVCKRYSTAEDDKPDTLAEALASLERGLAEYFKREGIERKK
jgi:predicted phosphodiesterase